jgi:putative ABC transport system permease protein
MFSIYPSINISVVESNQTYKLAHLEMRFQGNDAEIQGSIDNLIASNSSYSDVSYEIRPSCNLQIYHQLKWYYSSVIGINTTDPPEVNQINSNKELSALQNNTALILESFAKELDVEIGDTIKLYTLAGVKEIEIAGLVQSIEFLSYDLSLEGAIYVNYQTFQVLNDYQEIQFNSVAFYFPNDPPLETLVSFADQLKEQVNLVEAQFLYTWYVREFSISSLFQDVLNLTSQVLFVLACAVILGAGIVIFLITKRYAVEQRKQTGMLYAFGFPSRIILQVFMFRTLILSLISIGIGILGSYGLLHLMLHILISRWGIPMIIAQFSIIGLIVVPILVIISSQLFTYFACRSNVKMTPYEAIRGKQKYKINKKKKTPKKIPEKEKKAIIKTDSKTTLSLPISIKYPLRNISRNRIRGVLITFAFIGAIAISFGLIQTQSSINGTFDNYFEDQIHWDVLTKFDNYKSEMEIEQILEKYQQIKNYESYFKGNIEIPGRPEYSLNIRGLEENSTLYTINQQEGVMFSNGTAQEGIISSYSAKPLDLEVGDIFKFKLLGVEFQIKIVGILRDLDVPNSCFMLVPAIEKTLGFSGVNNAFIQLKPEVVRNSEDVNSFLLELNENSQIQYATIKESYETQMVHMVNTQLFIVKIAISLAMIISFMIIFVTAFVSINERKREIALQRAFGFKKSQIWFQMFLEMSFLIGLALIIGFAIGAEGLGRLIQFIIGRFFFDLDFVYYWSDYLIIGGFAFGSILLSTIPSINILQKQKIATAIIE